MRRLPQLLTLSWMAWCTLLTLSFFVRLMCSRLLLSTNRIANRWCCSWVIGQRNLAPWPFFLCGLIMQMLITTHPARVALLPWHRPWVLILIPPPENYAESPNPVRRKNFMFSIAPSIDSTAVVGTPNAWKISNAIACAILS
jgi:hypothetical protein